MKKKEEMFGEVWSASMMRHTKKDLVSMLRSSEIKRLKAMVDLNRAIANLLNRPPPPKS